MKLLRLIFFSLSLCMAVDSWAADQLEFMNGTKVTGKLVTFDNKAKQLTFEFTFNNRQLKRTFPYAQIHALTWNEKRHVLTAKAANPAAQPARTQAQVEAVIAQAGQTPPAWLKDTRLNYPRGLDLNWPLPPPKGWNNQKNIGQFVWDIINPNPNRWREGIRFMQFLKDRPGTSGTVRRQAHKALGNMYFIFLQDYARAAYWWRQAGAHKHEHYNNQLAECYFRLGNKAMAEAQLRGARQGPGTIKLYGAIGELDTGLRLLRSMSNPGVLMHGHISAGDACRQAGRTREAIDYYQKAHDSKEAKDPIRKRMVDCIAALRLEQKANLAQVNDGTYQGISTGYSGPLHVTATVKAGRLTEMKITRHREKQFYSSLTDTRAQLLAKQSVRGIDATSRATITSQAIVNATAQALAKGAR